MDENGAFVILAAVTCMQNMSRERLVRDHIHACVIFFLTLRICEWANSYNLS